MRHPYGGVNETDSGDITLKHCTVNDTLVMHLSVAAGDMENNKNMGRQITMLRQVLGR